MKSGELHEINEPENPDEQAVAKPSRAKQPPDPCPPIRKTSVRLPPYGFLQTRLVPNGKNDPCLLP
jgi:hypothetical protein